MDILSGKFLPNFTQTRIFSAAAQPVKGVVRRLTGFFSFTKEDQMTAGIFVGGEGREKINGPDSAGEPNDPSVI
jgi:hypothetical protein